MKIIDVRDTGLNLLSLVFSPSVLAFFYHCLRGSIGMVENSAVYSCVNNSYASLEIQFLNKRNVNMYRKNCVACLIKNGRVISLFQYICPSLFHFICICNRSNSHLWWSFDRYSQIAIKWCETNYVINLHILTRFSILGLFHEY